MSEMLDATGDGREAALARAAELLRGGKLVVVPTDTVYGLAADAFDVDATTALFAAKGRDRSVPLPVLIRTPKQLPGLTRNVPPAADHLVAAFWPGPLTLVLEAQNRPRWDLGETEGTISIRMPLDEVTLEVIRSVGPLAVTSAGASVETPPRTVAEAEEALGDKVDAYLDAGPRGDGIPSTIVDLTRSRPHVLRDGVVPTVLALDVAEGLIDPVDAARRLAEGSGTGPEDRTGAEPEEVTGPGHGGETEE